MPNGKKSKRKAVSRRDFIRKSATTAMAASLAEMTTGFTAFPASSTKLSYVGTEPNEQAKEQVKVTLKVDRRAILFAIGDTLIPSAPGDPGFKDLEWYGITEEINSRLEELSDADLSLFNDSSIALLKKKFTELSESQRPTYLNHLLESGSFKNESMQKKVQEVYSHVREVVFTVYYQNFPEDHWPRDANRVPLLRPGDEHQITNPSTTAVVTGWDVTGYAGPLTWEEEERRRNYFKKINWVGN
jgi:hypothetical protein